MDPRTATKIPWPISYFLAEPVGSQKVMNLFLLSRSLFDGHSMLAVTISHDNIIFSLAQMNAVIEPSVVKVNLRYYF